jgi:RND family efflux transporter MFP subunit
MAAVALLTAGCHAHTHEHAHADDSPRMEWWGFTEHHEVFIDAAVPDSAAAFYVHFTELKGFQPARDVSVRMEFKSHEGVDRVKGTPVQAGIWQVEWTPGADAVEATLWWATPDADGQIPLGRSTSTGPWEGWSMPGEAVAFGREQVWSVPFATSSVQRDTVWEAMALPGKWMAAPGDDRVVAAGASGTLRWAMGIPVAGAAVKRGQVLARIEVGDLAGSGLAAEAVQAEAEWEAAESAVRRLKPLYEAGMVTAGEWEAALARQTVATEAWERLQSIRAEEAWEVRAPMDGFVRSVFATSGSYLGADAPLCVLTSDREQWLEVRVNPAYRSRLERAQSVRVRTEAGWRKGDLASIANQIDAQTGLLNAYIALDEVVPGTRPTAGSFAEVQIEYGNGTPALVLPASALLEQYGQFEVAVQVSGEQFQLQPVQIGARNALQAEVLSGLDAGDRVVTTGAYAVRMASLKGSTPAHGHTH